MSGVLSQLGAAAGIERWISGSTYIRYVNFVSYLKLVQLTLLLAFSDLLGLGKEYT